MNREIMAGAACGGSIVVLALGASTAHRLGTIDADTVTRLVYGGIGLMTAWFGNRIPKTFVASALARRAQRVAGWSTVLSGLSYAGMWVFAPIPMALWGGAGAILAGFAVTIGYCFWMQSQAKFT